MHRCVRAAARKQSHTLLVAALVFALAAPAVADEPLSRRVLNTQSFAGGRVRATEAHLARARYPYHTERDGSWNTVDASGWTSGFLPGEEWLEYQRTGSAKWRGLARSRQAPIAPQQLNSATHDLGFMFVPSYVADYRLTGNANAKRVAATAARSLAKRWSSRVGMIRSRNSATGFQVIIDTLMNLDLMFWGARNGGPASLKTMARDHALKARRDFVRPDGGTWHLVVYDRATGSVTRKGTRQGAGPDTTWSRGQAWAIYGFTIAFRETGDARFLDTARRCADYYLDNLPADGVPYWDFSLNGVAGEPRDSSAGAVAASGLAELSLVETDTALAGRYAHAARSAVCALTSRTYLADSEPGLHVLRHGTLNKPGGHYDSGLPYGDYYLLEAMLKLRRMPSDHTPLPVVESSASVLSSGTASGAFDGDAASVWVARAQGAWVAADLGTTQTVSCASVATWSGRSRAAKYSILASEDGVAWTRVMTTMSSGLTSGPEVFDFPDVEARYIRIVALGTSRNTPGAITDIRIY